MNTSMPNVYISDVNGSSPTPQSLSAFRGMMLGVTRSGDVGESVLITSWTEFIEKFANGLETPFMEESMLPNAVYGYFSNGGTELYVSRVVSVSAQKATKTGETCLIKVTAKSVGAWGNGIVVEVAKNSDNTTYDIKVTNDKTTVTLEELTKDTFISALQSHYQISKWIDVEKEGSFEDLAVETIILEGGSDGMGDIKDDDFTNALTVFDNDASNSIFISIPGQTSDKILNAVTNYAEKMELHPILTAPQGSSVENVKALRKRLSCYYGEIVYPWGYINDVVTGNKKIVSPEGYVMGMYSSIISTQGINKVPAGTTATVKGFIALEKNLTDSEVGELNKAKVVSIINKKNLGIVVWGARGLNDEDDKMRYVSDSVINLVLKKELYQSTLFSVFQPNTDALRASVTGICSSILETHKNDGVIQAYQVICNDTNNTQESIDNGNMNIAIAYAPSKPTEFVFINLSHTYSESSN